MAFSSKCLSCNATRFEIKEIELMGAKWRYYAVQCATCGGVVGTVEFFNAGAKLGDIEKSMEQLTGRVNNIQSSLSSLVNQLNQIVRTLPNQ